MIRLGCCPKCNEPLVGFELDGVEIDRCVECGGIWLDPGELEQIAEFAGVPPGPMTHALHHARQKGEPRQERCPRCGVRMRRAPVGEKEAVELDHCPLGHGLWFDRGELQSVVENFCDAQDDGAAVARFFGEMFRRG